MSTTTDERPTSMTSVRVIRLPDLDRPLYRIFPLWLFEDALQVNSGRLVLVRPSAWEDPLEDPGQHIIMRAPDWSQKELAGYLLPAYAQCWSFEGGSDALLRAYSRVTRDQLIQRNVEPKYEGVQVRTTPRKLIYSLNRFLAKRGDLQKSMRFYVGAIRYVPDVAQEVINRLEEVGPAILGQGDDGATSLLMKREAFQHESEVRIVMLAPPGSTWEHFTVDIDPNYLFEEVRFDPRLAEFEKNERQERAVALGYKGPFGSTETYQKILFDVPLTKHWDEHLNANSVSHAQESS